MRWAISVGLPLALAVGGVIAWSGCAWAQGQAAARERARAELIRGWRIEADSLAVLGQPEAAGRRLQGAQALERGDDPWVVWERVTFVPDPVPPRSPEPRRIRFDSPPRVRWRVELPGPSTLPDVEIYVPREVGCLKRVTYTLMGGCPTDSRERSILETRRRVAEARPR